MVGVLHLESLGCYFKHLSQSALDITVLVFSRQGLPVYPKLALNFWSPCLG